MNASYKHKLFTVRQRQYVDSSKDDLNSVFDHFRMFLQYFYQDKGHI